LLNRIAVFGQKNVATLIAGETPKGVEVAGVAGKNPVVCMSSGCCDELTMLEVGYLVQHSTTQHSTTKLGE